MTTEPGLPPIPGRLLYRHDFQQQTGTGIPDTMRWTNPATVGTGSSVAINSNRLFLASGSGTGNMNASVWLTQSPWPANIGILVAYEPSAVTGLNNAFSLRGTDTTVASNGIAQNSYCARSTSDTNVEIDKVAGGTITTLVSGTPSPVINANGITWCRFEIVGNILTAKWWQAWDGSNAAEKAEDAAVVLSVVDNTYQQPGFIELGMQATNGGSRTLRLYRFALYEPQIEPSPLIRIIAPIGYGQAGQTRSLAAAIPTSSSAKAVASRTQRLLVKPNTASSAKAIRIAETKPLSAKSAAAMNIPSMTVRVGGTVSFSTKVTEATNSRFRRVAPPTVSGLARAYQAAMPTAYHQKATVRRAVRRTGKVGTASSAKATTTTKIRQLVVTGSNANKPKASTSAKAVLSTTATTGNPPAIPSTIAAGVSAPYFWGWGTSLFVDSNRAKWQEWRTNFGLRGCSGSLAQAEINVGRTLEQMSQWFYFQGTDVTNIVDPLNVAAAHTSTFNYHNGILGYGAPPVNGQPYGTVLAGNYGPSNFKKNVDPGFLFFIAIKMRRNNADPRWGYVGDWFDDATFTTYARIFNNFAAGAKSLGADGLTFDWESSENFEPTDVASLPASGNQTGQIDHRTSDNTYWRWTGTAWVSVTLSAVQTQAEARGHQIGQAIFSVYPNCSLVHYEWRVAGGPYDSVNHSNYPRPQSIQDYFLYGMMRAMQEANGVGNYFWMWDAQFYKASYFSATRAGHTQRAMQNAMAILSQRLPPAVRDFMMSRFAIIPAAWKSSDGSAPGQTGEPEWQNTNQFHHNIGMHGWRSIYLYDFDNNQLEQYTPPGGTKGSLYTQPTTPNPPGFAEPGMQAIAAQTGPQDTMTVSGSAGIYQVSVVGHGTNPQATVECELTATVSNNGSTTINAPGVGFYDANGTEVGFAASGGGTLAPGANQTYSTLTSPVKSAYIPAAAGTVTIRAKPGINGVDQNQGVLDQTFTVAAAPPPPPPSQYFISSSSWNTPIPAGATYTDNAALHGAGWIETHTYGSPVVHATTSDPLTTLTVLGGPGGTVGPTWGWPETTVQVHCPSSMSGASGTDGSIVIIEPAALNGYAGNEAYSFWQFVRTSPTSANVSSYAHTNITTGDGWGTLSPFKGAGIHAAGNSLLAGLLVGNELTAGIHHTLNISMRFDLVQSYPNFVAPAISCDGNGGSVGIKEGMRVGIPPATAMPGGLTIQEQTLWTACKTYGCFVTDVNGGNQSIQFWGDGLSVPDSDVAGLINPTTFATTGMDAISAALRIVT